MLNRQQFAKSEICCFDCSIYTNVYIYYLEATPLQRGRQPPG